MHTHFTNYIFQPAASISRNFKTVLIPFTFSVPAEHFDRISERL